jgi:galactoside 2-L-fucosyltransferase 1/2
MITFTELGHWGRLGNQMYEYATLLGIGLELGYDVAIPPPGSHLLGECFDVTAPILTASDRERVRHVFAEPRVGYSDRYRSIEDFTDLRGFFQSPRYFPPREVVVAEFTFVPRIQRAADAALAPWRECGRPVVGVTVRRGDYLLHPHQFVSLSDTSFYDQAIALVEDLDPVFLVSSDEPAWCREHFTDQRFHVIDDVGDYVQLAMLTQCDHLILANSSYGWWAAWLNDGDGQRIAASRWYGDDCEYPEADRDPLPDGWVEVPV